MMTGLILCKRHGNYDRNRGLIAGYNIKHAGAFSEFNTKYVYLNI
jgi:hypothetical protein